MAAIVSPYGRQSSSASSMLAWFRVEHPLGRLSSGAHAVLKNSPGSSTVGIGVASFGLRMNATLVWFHMEHPLGRLHSGAFVHLMCFLRGASEANRAPACELWLGKQQSLGICACQGRPVLGGGLAGSGVRAGACGGDGA